MARLRDYIALIILVALALIWLLIWVLSLTQESDYQKVLKNCDEKGFTRAQCEKGIDIYNKANPDNPFKR